MNGGEFTKLILAVIFDNKTEKNLPSKGLQASSNFLLNHSKDSDDDKNHGDKSTGIAQKTIHNTISTATGHEQFQTDQICTETLKRVGNILGGPLSGVSY